MIQPSSQFAIIPLATLANLAECSRTEILAYTALAAHADETGYCWPGRARLATLTGLDPTRISKATAGLVAKGLIRKDYTPRSHVAYTLLSEYPRQISGVPKLTPRTDHQNSKETERPGKILPPLPPTAALVFSEKPSTQHPEPTPATPAAPLETLKTPPPDCVPDSWLEDARQIRPDIPLPQLTTTASVFLDHYRAKGTTLKTWRYAWLGWIRKERVYKGAKAAPKPANTGRAIPLSDEQKAALEARTAALEAFTRQQHEARLSAYRASIPAKQDRPLRAIDASLEDDERQRQRRIEQERQRINAALAERGIFL